MIGSLPFDEEARLAAVRRYDILDTPPDGAFDRITALAARFFHVPIAIVSIVDEDRIWFKSRHGLDAQQIPRDPGLCASAILRYTPYVVPDAQLDPVALTNPLVAGEFGLRFYAAAPLTTVDGYNLGTLCIIDQEPRQLADEEVEALQDFSGLVVGELELRLEARRLTAEQNELRERVLAQKHEADELARVLQASLLPPRLPPIPGLELAACYRPANGVLVGGDFYDVFPLPRRAWGVVLGDVCGKGPEAAGVTAAARYAVRAAAMEHDSPSEVLRVLNEALLIDQKDEPRFCTLLYGRVRHHGKAFQLTLASGGHPLPRVLRRNGSIERVGEFGTLVGCLPEVDFADSTVALKPGDAVVFYTDGLVEAPVGDDMLGMDGLASLLASCAGYSAAAITRRLQEAVFQSGQPQRDDLAILVVKVKEES
jgi:sigma-B regulation protein RsbU (phosphoserine phosphatase)